MKQKPIDIVGWYGALAILAAYALLSWGKLGPQAVSYQMLNLTGALALIVETAVKRDYEVTVLNIVWFAVAAVALVKILY